MTSSNNNIKIPSNIEATTLISLYKIGFKIVPLSENHKPVIEWGTIYENPNYWKKDSLKIPEKCKDFKNVASTLGKSHLNDMDNKELFIQVLDCDSEYVYDTITKPIGQLNTSSILQSKICSFLIDGLGISENEFVSLTLLDVFKKNTFVTKTRKPHGFHIWWLSHNQNKSISTKDCKKGYEFEIKTDKKNGLCTLPPSTHRNDSSFTYSAIGRTDKILVNDILYNLFIELFNDCLRKDTEENKNNGVSNKNSDKQQPKNIIFHSLSPLSIQASVDYLMPYYIDGNRHNFALPFSGTTFHSRISEESASLIMEGICDKSNDFKEKQDRLNTLRSIYKNGMEGRPITGGPTLADLIARVKEYDISFANTVIDTLKKLWQNDISSKKEKNDSIPKELSVAQAKREKSGFVKVKGTIIGLSPVYNMIKSVSLDCNVCGNHIKIDYPKPIYKSPFKEKNKCSVENIEHGYGYTLIANCEYVSVVDIELQDLDGYNEIERLVSKNI